MKEKFGFHILRLYTNKFLDKLENAFQLDSADLIKVYHNKAGNCVNRGRYDEAVALCQKAIKLDRNNVEAHYQLGIAYTGKRLDEEAVNSLQKVLKLDPDRAGAHFRLGVLLERTGALDSAITSYKKAIKLEPKRADFLYTLGVALDKKGEHKKAIESLRKAVELA
ncbi:MAG: tetratricopeptide repeat protein, partial [Planctomycetes bacterium]|nr:tetratricopeptide repeat protein [Planctomycetota bacterium]